MACDAAHGALSRPVPQNRTVSARSSHLLRQRIDFLEQAPSEMFRYWPPCIAQNITCPTWSTSDVPTHPFFTTPPRHHQPAICTGVRPPPRGERATGCRQTTRPARKDAPNRRPAPQPSPPSPPVPVARHEWMEELLSLTSSCPRPTLVKSSARPPGAPAGPRGGSGGGDMKAVRSPHSRGLPTTAVPPR